MKTILIIILLIFADSCNAQTLYKLVNGVPVALTTQEANALRAQWAVNDSLRKVDSIYTAKETVMKASIIQTAQSIVGIRYDQLTAAQVRILVGLLAIKENAIDTNFRIKPLNSWVRP